MTKILTQPQTPFYDLDVWDVLNCIDTINIVMSDWCNASAGPSESLTKLLLPTVAQRDHCREI